MGEKIQKTTLDLLELLIAASYLTGNKKVSALNQAAVKLDLLKILVRLSEEIKAIPSKQYISLQSNLQEIGKMLGGWIRSIK